MAITLVVAGSLEDHAVLKHAVTSVMADAVVEVGTDGYRALELARRIRPSIVVVDPTVPGLSARELISRLRAALPDSAVLCWTTKPDVDEATDLLRAGAAAYLLKEDGPKELVRQIPAVLEGGMAIAPRVATELAGRFTHSIHRETELTRALTEATLQLQETAISKDQFVANVNHELRTPVTIVKAIAHLLKSGRLSEEDQEQFVQRMDAAVERLTTMVDEILSVSDLGRGNVSLHPETADLAELLRAACDRIAEAYPEVAIDRQVMGTFENVLVDPSRIAEAMDQLLDNACRYSPPGGGIVVSLKRVDEGIVFSVTDSGEGLPRDVVRRAFREPFVTGEEILRKERAGLGLGLHLARQLVVLHGGIMWADPLPAGGTRVAFCIPEHSPVLHDQPNGDGPVVHAFEPGETFTRQASASGPEEPKKELATLLRELTQD